MVQKQKIICFNFKNAYQIYFILKFLNCQEKFRHFSVEMYFILCYLISCDTKYTYLYNKKGYDAMKVSFVGGGKKLTACYRIFEGKRGFEISGFYNKAIETCVDIAIEANAMIYQSLDSLYRDSDIIVLAINDRSVPGVIASLSRLHAHGKVFVTISDTLTSSDLSMAYPNACASINSSVDIPNMSDNEIRSASFVCEVFGKNYINFCRTMKSSDIRCKFLTSKQLQIYRSSLHMAKYGIEAAITSAMHLLKISTVSDSARHLIPVIKEALNHGFSYGYTDTASPYRSADLDEIRKHTKILEENGIESAKTLYNAIALYLTEQTCNDYEAADEAFRLIKNS